MQGFILSLHPVRDEDLWVHIITETELLRLYRFYGARHSVIAIGHKIDFCIQSSGTKNIAQLREVLQLAFPWERDRSKRSSWQSFMQLLYHHLKDIHRIDCFYYELLQNITERLKKQNAIRSLCEAYVKLLRFEGRASHLQTCFVCNANLGDHCAIVRSFLGICQDCLHESAPLSRTQPLQPLYERKKIIHFIENADAMFLSDQEITSLWKIILTGL